MTFFNFETFFFIVRFFPSRCIFVTFFLMGGGMGPIQIHYDTVFIYFFLKTKIYYIYFNWEIDTFILLMSILLIITLRLELVEFKSIRTTSGKGKSIVRSNKSRKITSSSHINIEPRSVFFVRDIFLWLFSNGRRYGAQEYSLRYRFYPFLFQNQKSYLNHNKIISWNFGHTYIGHN